MLVFTLTVTATCKNFGSRMVNAILYDADDYDDYTTSFTVLVLPLQNITYCGRTQPNSRVFLISVTVKDKKVG